MISEREMERLRVRLADLSGFDPEGLWLVDAAGQHEHIVLHADERDVLVHSGDSDDYPWWWTKDQADAPLTDPAAEPYLSTADARTRDALARWVAERVRMSPASTAPAWHVGDPAPQTWNLRWWYTEFVTFHAPRPSSYKGTKVSNEHEVPALGDLDAADPRRLPDGSRWVDAAALAAVCGWCVSSKNGAAADGV